MFQYYHKGLANGVVLHCSLQEATGRVYVQLREEGPSGSIHPLGLTLGRYVPDAADLKQRHWAGTMQHCNGVTQ